MKLFLDENIPKSAIKELMELGFKVEHASDAGMRGSDDGHIAAYAKNQKSILITKDLGFRSATVYPKGTHYGLVVLRLPHYFTAGKITRILQNFLRQINPDYLVGRMYVLELDRYRVAEI